ncbi:hypothetical protein PybrP1_000454 [[Pythium] brassicae (nom. inval.)]|nr:hypothetical protein PybrP1_000454 [[Pythium] brassicae (nom. inval.)]
MVAELFPHAPGSPLDEFPRSAASYSSSSSSGGRDRLRRRPRRRPSPPTMRAFAEDGSFAYSSSSGGSIAERDAPRVRRRRAPPTADLEGATSVLEATRRMELARQRSHVSFGKRTIDLDKTFRTAPPGSGSKLSLESPPQSPKRGVRAASASFMTPAQVIYAASTGTSSYLSTNSSSGSGSGGSTGSRSLSRQATMRAIAKGEAVARAGGGAAADGFASTGGSSHSATSASSSLRSSTSSHSSSSLSAAEVLAKRKAKKTVSFTRSETECCHDQSSAGSASVAAMLSPIHAACRKGDYLVVKHVLSFYYGNECENLVNSSCTCGMTPLQVACDNGHVKIAKLLLRRHASPNKRGSKRRHHSCLAMASIQRNAELVELLLQHGAMVDDDALVIAASSGYDDIVRLLVHPRPKRSLGFDRPAQLFHRSAPAAGATAELDAGALNKAASLAVTQEHPEMLAILLGDGRAPASHAKVAACALEATMQSDYRLLRALARAYDAAVLLSAPLADAAQCSLLHHAVRNESVKTVMLLVRLGADVHARDSAGITPLYIACARGHSSIVRLLVDAGAACASMGPNDESPLHIAAQENHLACIETLLVHGQADVDGLTRDRCTALHLACQRGNTQVAECLLEHGANVNALTVSDETPLLKASRMSQFHTVKLLMARGATTKASGGPTNEVGRPFDENHNHNSCKSATTVSRATPVDKRQGGGGGEDSIFIAKSNTHTSLRKWIRSVLKNDK